MKEVVYQPLEDPELCPEPNEAMVTVKRDGKTFSFHVDAGLKDFILRMWECGLETVGSCSGLLEDHPAGREPIIVETETKKYIYEKPNFYPDVFFKGHDPNLDAAIRKAGWRIDLPRYSSFGKPITGAVLYWPEEGILTDKEIKMKWNDLSNELCKSHIKKEPVKNEVGQPMYKPPTLTCQYCGEVIDAKEFLAHVESCPKSPTITQHGIPTFPTFEPPKTNAILYSSYRTRDDAERVKTALWQQGKIEARVLFKTEAGKYIHPGEPEAQRESSRGRGMFEVWMPTSESQRQFFKDMATDLQNKSPLKVSVVLSEIDKALEDEEQAFHFYNNLEEILSKMKMPELAGRIAWIATEEREHKRTLLGIKEKLEELIE